MKQASGIWFSEITQQEDQHVKLQKMPKEEMPKEKMPKEKMPKEKMPKEEMPKEEMPYEKKPTSGWYNDSDGSSDASRQRIC